MRRRPTRGERAFWAILKTMGLTNLFWRQTVILGWIVDFWCPSRRLAIEIDGPSHEQTEGYDARRANVMHEELGIRTVRFTNEEVLRSPLLVESRVRALLSV